MAEKQQTPARKSWNKTFTIAGRQYSYLLVAAPILLLTIALAVLAGRFLLQNNTVAEANSLKSRAKHEYNRQEFVKAVNTYKYLVDSLQINEDEVSFNYANAAFLASGLALPPTDIQIAKPDSTAPNYSDIALQEYSKLAASGRTAIASKAANQLGVTNIKASERGPASDANAIDSALRNSLSHFREALRKDPENDSARYNYELVKKLVDYPEHIVNQVKDLVSRRQYKPAAELLASAMRRDKRLKQQQQELMKRLKDVVGIDSLDTKTSL